MLVGFTVAQAAQLLRVSVRTVRNWEARRVGVPYSALELLRIQTGYALPGDEWRGFTLRGGLLWSPEGRSFEACRLAYWGLTCSAARDWFADRERVASRVPVDAPAGAAANTRARERGAERRPVGTGGARVSRDASVVGLRSGLGVTPIGVTVNAGDRSADWPLDLAVGRSRGV